MADPGERLQPTQLELDHATDRARPYWHTLADEVMTRHENGSIPQGIVLHDMLCRVPAMPDIPVDIYKISLGPYSESKAILTAASSTMRPTDDTACGVGEAVKVTRGALLIGIQKPVSCIWSGTSFCRPSMTDGGRCRPNYVGVMSLAWSYIFSVRLLEMQRHKGAEIVYLNSTAISCPSHDERQSAFSVDIGNIGADAARWWAAILAPGHGWKAIISEEENEPYHAPWSLSLEIDKCPSIIWGENGPLPLNATAFSPPSSQTALKFLAEFCLLHDLDSQLHAAFAAALTFPTHNHYKSAVELPPPVGHTSPQKVTAAKRNITEQLAIYETLPYYITLSCNYSVVISSLCGSFWEPDIPCNLVNPWLHPVLNEVPRRAEIIDIPGRYIEALALMCGIRRPRLAALWIGAAISGLVPKVLGLVKGGTPPLDPNGFPWTGSPQNFMDFAGSGPYFHSNSSGQNMIRRVDVWRLLYLPVLEDDGLYYRSLPFSPWEPVGESKEANCVLRVQAHRLCSRHHLIYQHWTWNLRDGSNVHDNGFTPVGLQDCPRDFLISPESTSGHVHPIMPLSQDQEASREASIAIFEWVLANHEGKPSSEPIYDDDWIAQCIDEDGSDLGMEGSASDSDSLRTKLTPSVSGNSGVEDDAAVECRVSDWVNNVS